MNSNKVKTFKNDEISMCVTVEQREYGTVTKEMVQEQMEDLGYLDEFCACDNPHTDDKCDLLDVIWGKIVDGLNRTDCTINQNETKYELFGNRGGLDMDEVVKLLIEDTYEESLEEHSCS
jgi:hypothetical protein